MRGVSPRELAAKEGPTRLPPQLPLDIGEAGRLALALALRGLDRELVRARAKAERASKARASLPPGTSRARVTTANARHATACAEWDRLEAAHGWATRVLGESFRGEGPVVSVNFVE